MKNDTSRKGTPEEHQSVRMRNKTFAQIKDNKNGYLLF